MSETIYPVRVYTRWHQSAIPLGFALALLTGLTCVYQFKLADIAILFIAIALVLPPLIAGVGFPTRDSLKIEPDKLTFNRRIPLLYKDISYWSAERGLILKRERHKTLVIISLNVMQQKAMYHDFFKHLQIWQNANQTTLPTSKAARFYGSWRARVFGAVITAASAFIIIAALSMPQPSYYCALLASQSALFGTVLLSGKRPF